jgi:hypothetical protein
VSGSVPVGFLKLARKWLADTIDDLRDRRLAPLSEQSRAIWADLRQGSNVGLGAFRLVGANTTRRLDKSREHGTVPAFSLPSPVSHAVSSEALAPDSPTGRV